ncbi:GNAT family N-acetyltransferase [Bacillus tianshenii]|uniref:GNAT family N-acetyltransferase n=1 Tax=Sutcliffiella tianshenii TaxID=1463404 RepID=UPI001CD61A76|nr:GNAT family N-acetyltransferase [Bacillus tianshenii]MCA1321639.1 GNAT family N-acetyltransferase [Bacillus tianshenii]
MNIIVQLKEKHFKEAIALSEYAFQYKVPEADLPKRMEQVKKHAILGIFEDEQLAAKLHLIPLEVHTGEQKWKMGGIAGVATYPEYRRKGYVKELMKQSLKQMKEEGYLVSMLHPFKISFYRKYGWELLTNRVKCTITRADLVLQGLAPGSVKRAIEDHNYQDLNEVYSQFATRFSGMLVRDESWWKNICDGESTAIYYNKSQQAIGYILYSIKDSKMKVEEFVALTSEARKGLWNFICQHDSMLEQVEMILQEKDPLLFSLQEPNVKAEIAPYFMVRIVDAEKFLKGFAFQWSDTEVVLQISDPYASWNEKTFSLKNGEVIVIDTLDRIEGSSLLKLDINALSTILFGYNRPMELYELELLDGRKEDIERLESLLPNRPSFFYDFF